MTTFREGEPIYSPLSNEGRAEPQTSAIPSHAEAQAYFDEWGATYSVPTILVLQDLTVLWNNGAALLAEANGDFSLSVGVLSLEDKTATAELKNFVRTLTTRTKAWVYRRGSSTPPLVVGGETIAPLGQLPGAALMFYAVGGTDRYVWPDIGEVFGLTKAEVRIVKRLIAGERADDIAVDTNATLETIRTHIRRAYGKLGVGTREQLFATIAPFRVG